MNVLMRSSSNDIHLSLISDSEDDGFLVGDERCPPFLRENADLGGITREGYAQRVRKIRSADQ